jgi:hypothetical protein
LPLFKKVPEKKKVYRGENRELGEIKRKSDEAIGVIYEGVLGKSFCSKDSSLL